MELFSYRVTQPGTMPLAGNRFVNDEISAVLFSGWRAFVAMFTAVVAMMKPFPFVLVNWAVFVLVMATGRKS
jgi:hypothetical protein